MSEYRVYVGDDNEWHFRLLDDVGEVVVDSGVFPPARKVEVVVPPFAELTADQRAALDAASPALDGTHPPLTSPSTLAEVLAAGNDAGGSQVIAAAGSVALSAFLELDAAAEGNPPTEVTGGNVGLEAGTLPGSGHGGVLTLSGATRVDDVRNGGQAILSGGEQSNTEAGGGFLQLNGGTNDPADAGGDATLRGGYTHDSDFVGAEVIAGGAADAADGRVAVKTANSTGELGQALVSDGNGKVRWAYIDGRAVDLAFDLQPTNTDTGAVITPSVTVNLLDYLGVLVTGDSTTDVTVSASAGTLSGTLTQTAVAGVATFDDLEIAEVESGVILTVTATGLFSATSDPFDVTAP